MAENTKINDSVRSLLSGLDGFISSKSVIGTPIEVNGTLILPVTDIQVGVGVGTYSGKNNGTGGGMGAKMSPSAVLILQKDGASRLVNIKNQDAVTKVLDMVPDVVDKIFGPKVKDDPDVEKKVDDIVKNAAEEKL